ncbi:hypothetical protein MRF4_29270 [Methylobacterium radiotolerans]
MIRRAAASYWTVLAIGLVLLALHVWWFWLSDHQADVLAGGGAALGVFGVWIAALPNVRLGFAGLVNAGLPQINPGFYVGENFADEVDAIHESARPGVTRNVRDERVTGVVIIVIGALLNGYASAIARALGLRDLAS